MNYNYTPQGALSKKNIQVLYISLGSQYKTNTHSCCKSLSKEAVDDEYGSVVSALIVLIKAGSMFRTMFPHLSQ